MNARRPALTYCLLAVLLLALTTLLAACSDAENPTPVITTTSATSAAPALTATSVPPTPIPTLTATPIPPTATAVPTATPVPPKPLVIGLITSRTGAYAAYGEMLERGFMLGLNYYTQGTNKINGHEVKVLIEDDSSDPDKAVAAARKLVQQEGAEILVGTPGSPAAQAVSAVNDTELKKIFMATPVADPSLAGLSFSRYLFRLSSSPDQAVMTGATYAATLASATRNERIASFYPATPAGQSLNTTWKEAALATDDNISWVEVAVPTTATDFTTYIQKVLNANPDVLVLNWSGSTTAKLYLQMQAKNVFSEIDTISPVGDGTSLKAAGDDLIGTLGVSSYWYQFPKTAENDALVKAFKDKYNTFPDLYVPDGFAAFSAIQAALARTGGDTDPEKLIPALEGMSFATPKGKETFRKEDHLALQPMYIVRLLRDNTGTYAFPIPQLIKELSPEEAAAPVRKS
ncbi:MAG: ABC transporter substrate-binding protein [Chloroflexi bacterium]|nr:ABC transporter substrate-binding protein [Chloroflexota bacterium]